VRSGVVKSGVVKNGAVKNGSGKNGMVERWVAWIVLARDDAVASNVAPSRPVALLGPVDVLVGSNRGSPNGLATGSMHGGSWPG
jgi:hypothetical protein